MPKRKEPGDPLFAEDVNHIASKLRRARNVPAPFRANRPWEQRVVQLKGFRISKNDNKDSGLYAVSINGFATQSTLDADNIHSQWPMDGRDIGVAFASYKATSFGNNFRADRVMLVAWWDPQRGMYIPATGQTNTKCNSLVDFSAREQHVTTIAVPSNRDPSMSAALEMSGSGAGGWSIPNKMVINASAVDLNGSEPVDIIDVEEQQSAEGTYTVVIDDVTFFRVAAVARVGSSVEATADWVGLRFESVCNQGTSNVFQAPFEEKSLMGGWSLDAAVRNEPFDSPDVINDQTPKYSVASDGKAIKVEPPTDPVTNQFSTWTINVNVAILFGFGPRSSSSSSSASEGDTSSSSSPSSLSSSSASSELTSSSESSASSVSSSSPSSESSVSSSSESSQSSKSSQSSSSESSVTGSSASSESSQSSKSSSSESSQSSSSSESSSSQSSSSSKSSSSQSSSSSESSSSQSSSSSKSSSSQSSSSSESSSSESSSSSSSPAESSASSKTSQSSGSSGSSASSKSSQSSLSSQSSMSSISSPSSTPSSQ